MLDKIGKVSNPLTIVAIFAATVEVSASTVLPFICDHNQNIFIYFLMIFPSVLLLLFFITLNFNHRVLYAPSDWRDEENFFRLFDKSSRSEQEQKLRQELDEARQDLAKSSRQSNDAPTQLGSPEPNLELQTLRSLEHLALSEIAVCYGPLRPAAALVSPGGRRFAFDGIFDRDSRNWLVEVKYLAGSKNGIRRANEVITAMSKALEGSPSAFRDRLGLMIVFVGPFGESYPESEVESRIKSKADELGIRIMVKFFDEKELQAKVRK